MKIFFLLFQLHAFEYGEELDIWFNHLSPKSNPLKFSNPGKLFDCSIKFKDEYYSASFAEHLEDLTLLDSGMKISFKKPEKTQKFCGVLLTKPKLNWLSKALKAETILEVKMLDFNTWVPIGRYKNNGKTQELYTHYKLDIFYNEDTVVYFKLNPMMPVPLDYLENLDFFYEVNWKLTNETLSSRVTSYNIMKKQMGGVYFFAFCCNLIMIVVVGCLLISGIIFKVRADVKKVESSGWLEIKDLVFRPPRFLTFFSCLIATGWHFGATLFSVAIFNYFFEVYLISGGFGAVLFVSYIGFSGFSGFICGFEVCKYRGKMNSLLLALSSSLMNILLFCLFIMKSAVNDYLIDIRSFIIILFAFCLIYTPLYILGYYLGKTFSNNYSIKYSKISENEELLITNTQKPWLFIISSWLWMFLLLIPVLDSIVKSTTSFVYYSTYDLFLGSIINHFIAAALNSIFVTFLALDNKNHDWHWTSFLTGSGVGLFTFSYGVYIYFNKLNIHGVVENLYFFSLITISSFILCLVSGAVGYFSVGMMIKKIYSYIKIE